MGVDERREGVQAGGIHRLDPVAGLDRPGCADLGDLAAAHEQVAGTVEAFPRVEQVGALDQEVGGGDVGAVQEAHAGCGSVVSPAVAPISAGAPPWPPASSS